MPTTDANGAMAFQLASSEHGISPYSLLEAAWCLPAILYGIRNQVWLFPFTRTQMPHPVVMLWVEMGFLSAEPVGETDVLVNLTEAGHNIVRMGELFEYEYSMMAQQLDGDTYTDPEKYRRLRKALGYYADTYLAPLEAWMIGRAHGTRFLDFGGGDGHFLRKLLEADATGKCIGVLYDKAPEKDDKLWRGLSVDVVRGNFLEKSPFVKAYAHKFDTIIFSEVLHCLSVDQYDIVLPKLVRLMSPDSKLFVIEQAQSFRMNWRLHDMTLGGFSLSLEQVVEIFHDRPHLGLQASEVVSTGSHYAVCFTPIEVKNDSIN